MKRILRVVLLGHLLIPQAPAQSLAEAARREADRRRQLEEQKVEGKVIEANSPGQLSRGGLATFSGVPTQSRASGTAREPKARTSLNAYRTALRKLDREILEVGERRSLLLRRAEAEKWTLPKPGSRGGTSSGQSLRDKLRKQADDLEVRLKSLERRRMETREEARKAGYLPGEIDGKALAR